MLKSMMPAEVEAAYKKTEAVQDKEPKQVSQRGLIPTLSS
jgi:hypothetical protein